MSVKESLNEKIILKQATATPPAQFAQSALAQKGLAV
jgi:hypothetical protein